MGDYDYSSIEQCLFLPGSWTLEYSFYDHSMCGNHLLVVHLKKKKTEDSKKILIEMCCESPVEDGTPSLFCEEAIQILRLTFCDSVFQQNAHLTIQQRYSLLLRLCPALSSRKKEIEKEFNVKLSGNAWPKLYECPLAKSIRPEIIVVKLSQHFPMELKDPGYGYPLLQDEPDLFKHEQYNFFVTDDPSWEDRSFREESSHWLEENGHNFLNFLLDTGILQTKAKSARK